MKTERYKRQETFYGIGKAGQKKLATSSVLIIGMGALGSVIASNLCRAGVGFLKIIDRDYVELTNLQRQILFTEKDVSAGLPKVIATKNHLSEINSEVVVDAISDDVNSLNIEDYIKDVDLVLDGTDNFEIRFLINEACDKLQKKWIYGGAIGAGGGTMNILQGDAPCFRCFMEEMPKPGSYETCVTEGVTNSITGIIGSYEASEAIKILIGAEEVSKDYLAIDSWDNIADYIRVEKNPTCPVCVQKKYELLGKNSLSQTATICGSDAWQILPTKKTAVDFSLMAERLKKIGAVKQNKFLFSFQNEDASFKLFPDGRAIINNVKSERIAKRIYADYVGL
jgi:adenylyltransferase/sulfurtransferase